MNSKVALLYITKWSSFLQPFHMWIMLFNPGFFETTTRHTVWVFNWRNMVAIIHSAIRYFAYINDPLIQLREKVNLHHHPLRLTRLDFGDFGCKTPSSDNLMIWMYHNIDFFFFQTVPQVYPGTHREESSSQEKSMSLCITYCLEKIFANGSSKKLFCLCLLTVCRLQNVSILIVPRHNGKDSLAFSH